MPLLSEFERHAWDNRTKADRHPPVNALKAALDDIESGKLKVKHLFVVTIDDGGDEGDLIGYYQAGELGELAVEGALHRAIHIHWNS